MIHTGYSFKAAVGHLKDVVERLKAIGWEHAPIADRCSTFGYTRWTKLATEAGLTPIYGVELAVTPELGGKSPPIDYWTFLAIDDIAAIHDLVDLATDNNKFPILTYAQAQAARGVIRISGANLLVSDVQADDPNFYFGLTPAASRGLVRSALSAGLRPIAASCNAYPTPEDHEFYRIALTRFVASKGQSFGADVQTYPQHILSDDEWRAACAFSATPELMDTAIATRQRIFGTCKATLKKATMLKPERVKTLQAMCMEGAVKLQCPIGDPVYAARLERELQVIHEKNFEDYFYIIADLVAYAKQHMIVGPARGSSAGSLVCYLLGITAVDPIPYGLLFERFLDVTRTDLPDIDIDFSDQRRQLVFDYAEQKYGVERVARLGTVGMFQPRSALKQAAMGLRIPQFMLDKVFDSLLLRSSGDTRATQQIEDTLSHTDAGKELLAAYPAVVVAAKMEDHPHNASQHAAGIVLTQEPVRNYVAVDARTKSVMCDKKDAAQLNLLKIDALGLTQLSIFERTLELIGKPSASVHQFLERIPLDDQAAFDVLNRGHFAGIFQFMGITLQALTKQIKIESLNDIVAITALSRPGPMATGGSGTWARRRAGLESVTYPHPMLEPYLRETLGVVVYQETVMQVGREIGDLSWKDVTALRKAMSQSLGQEYFDQFGDKWKASAVAKGLPQDVANKFWFDMCAFGSWGFNKSHAVAYGLVSYQCCWLKAHYPLEFAAATLDAETSKGFDIRIARQIQVLREIKAEGIDYIPVDPAASELKWKPIMRNGRKVLLGPLTNIDGVGDAAAEEIITSRNPGVGPLRSVLQKKLSEPKTGIDTLEPLAARIQELYPNGLEEAKIVTEPIRIEDIKPNGTWQNVMIIGVLNKLNLRDENEHVNVERRGHKVSGPATSLLMFFNDDTDRLFVKVTRFKFANLGRDVFERGKVGKAIYAVKGVVPPDFKALYPNAIRYLGDMDGGGTRA